MRPIVEISFYSPLLNEWVELNKEFQNIVESAIINLSDFDIDTFNIMFYFPQDFGLYEEFLDSPFLMEGNLITIFAKYNEYPDKKSVLMSGVITGTKVRESLDDVIYTIIGADLSILLKGKITNAEVLKALSSQYIKDESTRNNAAVLLVRDILKKNREIMKPLNKKMREAYEEMPDFGLDFDETSIPDISDKENEYRRFVHVQNMSDAEKDIAKEDGREWGLADKPAQAEFLENLKEGSGYEIYTTYIETIASLGVILGRVFWYDSKEQKCYFKRPQDIENRQFFEFVKSNQTDLSPFDRILDFQADYSSLDAVWTIQSNFVSVTKDDNGKEVIKPIITQYEPEVEESEEDSTDTPTPILTGAESTYTEPTWWRHAVKTSPDSYEIQNSAEKTYYLKEFSVSAEIAIQGNPQIRPHDIIWLRGVGTKFEGAWFVKTIQHTINADKYVTNVELIRNLIALPKGIKNEIVEYKKTEIEKPKTETTTTTVTHKNSESVNIEQVFIDDELKEELKRKQDLDKFNKSLKYKNKGENIFNPLDSRAGRDFKVKPNIHGERYR